MEHPLSPPPAIPGILVIGGGLAATALVAALRSEGFEGEVTVAGNEPPYDRPPLSKELLSRSQPADLRDQFPSDAATWLTGVRATAVAGREVTLVDTAGRTSTATAAAVVLAVGARPTVPPGWDGVRTLSDWEDAEELRNLLTPGSHLVIAGAGWIGLEVASSASRAGVRVTIVEEAGRPLGRLIPAEVGRRIASWLGDVDLVEGRVAMATATTLRLADGREVAGDVVVAALGARPATGWLPAGWLTPGGHVRTDAAGRIPDAPGMWAIGDCAAGDVGGQHWNAAVAAAQRCAHALLGHEVPPAPPPTVFSSMFGHQVDLVGRSAPDLAVLWREGEGWTALLLADDDILVGGLAVDRPRDVAALRRALATGTPVIDRHAAADAGRRLAEAVRRR
ncbi:MAG: pyridine nucleotide-disulfide oxidoreductase [Actinobacteria bacterium]|nr:pyridine nucleotide-disulfide oxidoreductase [Actinomycetota bacterium]